MVEMGECTNNFFKSRSAEKKEFCEPPPMGVEGLFRTFLFWYEILRCTEKTTFLMLPRGEGLCIDLFSCFGMKYIYIYIYIYTEKTILLAPMEGRGALDIFFLNVKIYQGNHFFSPSAGKRGIRGNVQ